MTNEYINLIKKMLDNINQQLDNNEKLIKTYEEQIVIQRKIISKLQGIPEDVDPSYPYGYDEPN